MKLITEVLDDVSLLTEQTDKGSIKFIAGRYLQGGRRGVKEDVNGNGRIYTEDVLDSAANKFIEEKVKKNIGFGEMNHPSRATVDPERVCIVIKELSKDGLHYNGKSQIVERNPLGQIIIGIMESGGKIGVSSRALGSIKEEGGIKYVQPDLMFTAIDVVGEPSGQGCFVNGILEDVSFHLSNDGRIVEVKDMVNSGELNNMIEDAVKHKVDEAILLDAYALLIKKFSKLR